MIVLVSIAYMLLASGLGFIYARSSKLSTLLGISFVYAALIFFYFAAIQSAVLAGSIPFAMFVMITLFGILFGFLANMVIKTIKK